jgi:hypothetical protein
MSPEEAELFERNMARTGISNKSAFIRKMCIDGHVFNLELNTLNEIKRLLGISSNNLNQLTRRVNGGGNIYREDVEGLSEQYKDIRLCFGDVLTFLSELTNAKPGKRFIPPPTIRDLPEYKTLNDCTDTSGE